MKKIFLTLSFCVSSAIAADSLPIDRIEHDGKIAALKRDLDNLAWESVVMSDRFDELEEMYHSKHRNPNFSLGDWMEKRAEFNKKNERQRMLFLRKEKELKELVDKQ